MKARRQGLRTVRQSVIDGSYPYLYALDENLAYEKTAGEETLGVHEIPLAQIAGTRRRGRAESFARDFMPILPGNSEFAAKWESLYNAQLAEGIRDPIKVYEFCNRFYVEEGNKRVSVMKYIGAAGILAEVTRILPERTGDPGIERYYAFAAFNRVTGVFDIVLSKEEGYEKLAAYFDERLDAPWKEESVKDLRASFLRFSGLYESEHLAQTGLSVSDAYLLYLDLFGTAALLDCPQDVVREHIQLARTEFARSVVQGETKLVEEPEEDADKLLKTARPKQVLWGFRPFEGLSGKKVLKVAFLNDKSPETSRWTYGHSLGWQALTETYGDRIELSVYNHCDTEKETEEALLRAEEAGCSLIFTTAGQMYRAVLKEALRRPNIRFYNCSVNAPYKTVRSYYARMYEAKFILGAIAASLSETDAIGYAADYPVYGAVANINAFAVGAQLVRPKSRILLKWTTLRETAWQQEFKAERVSFISAPDLRSPSAESELFGLVHFDRKKRFYDTLAMPVIDWGRYYKLLAASDEREETRTQAVNDYWGMSAGVVDVFCSNRIPYATKKLLSLFKNEIAKGAVSPFFGELHTNDGRIIKGATSGRLESRDIVRMDWLNENIDGEIPPVSAFKDDAAAFLEAFGVGLSEGAE